MPQHYDDNLNSVLRALSGQKEDEGPFHLRDRFMAERKESREKSISRQGVDDRVRTLDRPGAARLLQESVMPRTGERKNVSVTHYKNPEDPIGDKSHSTHLMMREKDSDGNWYVFPALFQNGVDSWTDMTTAMRGSNPDWTHIAIEAQRRGELINFGKGENAERLATLYADEGSWKTE